MNEAIERAARKLCESCGVDPDDTQGGTWDGGCYAAGEPAWMQWADDAIAVVISLREPCPHAVAAAASKLGLDPYKIAGAWITMIDTMLERET